MDFHLATPTGDVYLFSYDGRGVQIPSNHIADVGNMVSTAPKTSSVEPECPKPEPI